MLYSIHTVRYQLESEVATTSILVQINSNQIEGRMKLYSSVDQESLLKVKINQQSTNSRE